MVLKPAREWIRPAAACVVVGLLGLIVQSSVEAAERSAELRRFEGKIRPLLVTRCGKCHSGPKPKGGLDLSRVDGLMGGGRSGPIVVPGNPTGSLLMQVIRRRGKGRMPPDAPLEESQILELVTWVKNGAVVPGADDKGTRKTGSTITGDDRDWWSFRSLDPGRVPVIPGDRWSRTPIDRYILARLTEEKLAPSPEASRRTWIRRATFDLWGLPPTPEAVKAFEADHAPGAFSRVVDRLLASPRYGERWSRHWLDVVRYADTNGGGFDYVYPNAWRYRDYVVRAFNRDTPYDRFLLEQLAGDLLEPSQDDQREVDRLLATGMLTLAPKGLGTQDKEQMAMDVVDDQIDVLGRSLMGLTLACARCHDHKFDPVLTSDYYALAGIFRSTVSVQDMDKNPSYWPERSLEAPSISRARKRHAEETKQVAAAMSKIVTAGNKRVIDDARKRLPEYLLAAAAIYHTRGDRAAVAHWPFDAATGKTVVATVGPGGRLANVSSQAPGKVPTRVEDGQIGRALRFGRGRVVEADAKALQPLAFAKSGDFSVSTWIRAPQGYTPKTADSVIAATFKSEAMWFIALRPGPYNGVYLRHYSGTSSVDIKPSSDQLPLLVDGKWHHLVVTSDRDADGIMYLDGRVVGRTPIKAVSSIADFGVPVALQLGASTNGFAGDLDDVAIWDRVIDAAEVTRLFQQGTMDGVPLDVAAVERKRSRKKATVPVEELLKRHRLVPSIARRLSRELVAAAGRKTSVLHPLTSELPPDVDQVKARVDLDSPVLVKRLSAKDGPIVPGTDAQAFYLPEVRKQLVALQARSRQLAAVVFPKLNSAMIAFDDKKPVDLRVHVAGDNRRLGDVVPRGFPVVLLDPDQSEEKIAAGTSGRLELARWLTRPEHPLTARVMVNRIWGWHFGEGLVRTPDNFGQLGEEPTHPHLLDHLAGTFVRDGWSLKRLHRRIMLSSVYRQASNSRESAQVVDADNRFLWRMSRRRLEAEPFRDAMLAVSGVMDSQMFGTFQTWKPKVFSVDDANNETANFRTRRRSLYMPVVRTTLHEMMELFDVGDPNSITSRRSNTTVAHQALFLLNNEFVQERARGLADRVRAVSGDQGRQIEQAWWLVLSRPPTPAETSRASAFLAASRKTPGGDSRKAWTSLAAALFSLNEFLFID